MNGKAWFILITIAPLTITLSREVEASPLTIAGNVNEESTIIILQDDRELFRDEGVTSFRAEIRLEEGLNAIQIIAEDLAGWRTIENAEILVDTSPPRLSNVVFEKGREKQHPGRDA